MDARRETGLVAILLVRTTLGTSRESELTPSFRALPPGHGPCKRSSAGTCAITICRDCRTAPWLAARSARNERLSRIPQGCPQARRLSRWRERPTHVVRRVRVAAGKAGWSEDVAVEKAQAW